MAGKDIKIRSSGGGQFDCYLVTPEAKGKVPAIVLASVEVFDGRLGVRVVVHLDEAEAATAAGLAVGEHLSGTDRAVLLEELLKVIVGD